MMPVRPYPWGALAPTTRDAEATARDVRRWIARHVDLAKLARVLGDASSGARVEVKLRGIVPSAAVTRAGTGAVAVVVVTFAAADDPEARATIEVESALAATLVARALRRPAPRVIDPRAPVDAALTGAFAAVLLAALRRAFDPARPLELVDASATSAPDAVTLALTAVVDDEAFLVRVTTSSAQARATPAASFGRDALAALGDLPLALPVVASASWARPSDLAALEPGAAWVPPREAGLSSALAALRHRGKGDGEGGGPVAPVAPVALAAPGADRGLRATLGADGRVVVLGSVESLAMDESALIENLGEVPVVVRVEIGSCSLRAREWAALGAGDVVALGRRVGEPVVLRVADREVARGELVEIDGEVGVRIVERLP